MSTSMLGWKSSGELRDGLVDGEWSVRVEDDVWKTVNMNRDYTFQMTTIKEAQKVKKPYARRAV